MRLSSIIHTDRVVRIIILWYYYINHEHVHVERGRGRANSAVKRVFTDSLSPEY